MGSLVEAPQRANIALTVRSMYRLELRLWTRVVIMFCVQRVVRTR